MRDETFWSNIAKRLFHFIEKKCSSNHAQFCQPISFYGQKLGGIYYFLLRKRTFADQFFWHNNNTIMLTCIFVCLWSFDGHFFSESAKCDSAYSMRGAISLQHRKCRKIHQPMYGKSYTILQSDLKKIQTWVIKTGSGLGLV